MNIQPLRTGGSIEEIIEKYKSMVYGIALTRVKNQIDAEDVFQEVFLVYFRKQPEFNEEEHRKAWLINTTIKCSQKIMRANRKREISFNDISENQCSEYIFNFKTERETVVYNSLCSLPEKYRTVLYLYYFEELSVKDISKILGIKEGTIRMQMLRGREMLKEILKGESFYD